jgi:hypothetical protein
MTAGGRRRRRVRPWRLPWTDPAEEAERQARWLAGLVAAATGTEGPEVVSKPGPAGPRRTEGAPPG